MTEKSPIEKQSAEEMSLEEIIEEFKGLSDELFGEQLVLDKELYEQMYNIRKVAKSKDRTVLSRSSGFTKFEMSKDFQENMGFSKNKK